MYEGDHDSWESIAKFDIHIIMSFVVANLVAVDSLEKLLLKTFTHQILFIIVS